MSARKSMAEQLKRTASEQRNDNEDRFLKADTVLLNGNNKTKKPQDDSKEESTKLIREGFLIPVDDHVIIEASRSRLAINGLTASKTEVIRLALRAINDLTDKQLRSLYQKLEPVKRGRPA